MEARLRSIKCGLCSDGRSIQKPPRLGNNRSWKVAKWVSRKANRAKYFIRVTRENRSFLSINSIKKMRKFPDGSLIPVCRRCGRGYKLISLSDGGYEYTIQCIMRA